MNQKLEDRNEKTENRRSKLNYISIINADSITCLLTTVV